MAEAWLIADTDQDGKLSFEEFAAASGSAVDLLRQLESMGPEIPNLHEQFLAMDADGNGFVDIHEARGSSLC